MGQVILCTGGARSGKSEFAERLALSQTGTHAYVATGQVFDEEMQDRVDKHKKRRGKAWTTYEIPYNLLAHWNGPLERDTLVLVDCLTMYVMNAFLDKELSQESANQIEESLLKEYTKLLKKIKESNQTVIFVTNELGMGIVPSEPLSRFFRDVAGKLNQLVSQEASQVYMTISGVTIELKSQEVVLHG